MKSLIASLSFVGCVLVAGAADAHFSLDFPKGRSNEIDPGPCGGNPSTRGSMVTTFHPGQSVKLQWTVMVAHTTPGRWRISIDDSGQDFPDPVGADDKSTLPLFMDNVEASGATPQELTVTLPNIECANCTLQLLQYKYEKPPYTDPSSFYYQCADIVITSDPNAPIGVPNPAAGAPAAGGSGNSAAGVPSEDGGSSGGSAAGGSPQTSSGGSAHAGSPAASGSGNGTANEGGCRFAPPRATDDASIALIALVLFGFKRRQRRA